MQRGSEDVLPFYWYSEETPKINWKLSDETKTMIGYNCKKATCRFRGRNYIAWYAMDIPIKAGPYKFSGLP
jgi:GLPGLI family protein